MKREYFGGSSDTNPDFFIGIEVEKTRHYGLNTLFCNGALEPHKINSTLRGAHGIEHVYLNLNHTVLINAEMKIFHLLGMGYAVTYEFGANIGPKIELSYKKLVHLMSVPVPQAEQDGLYIKIDDVGFNETNSGVWTFSLGPGAGDLENKKTLWSEYSGDKIIDKV